MGNTVNQPILCFLLIIGKSNNNNIGKISESLLMIYKVSGTILNLFQVLSHLIFTTSIWGVSTILIPILEMLIWELGTKGGLAKYA